MRATTSSRRLSTSEATEYHVTPADGALVVFIDRDNIFVPVAFPSSCNPSDIRQQRLRVHAGTLLKPRNFLIPSAPVVRGGGKGVLAGTVKWRWNSFICGKNPVNTLRGSTEVVSYAAELAPDR